MTRNPSISEKQGPANPEGFDDFLPYVIARIANKLNLDLMEDLRQLKINIARWRVLAVLSEKDGRSIGEMAEAAMMEQSALSRTIMRMEAEKLLRRKLLKKDNRYVQVYLTPSGRDLFEKLYPIVRQRHSRCVQGMSDQEVNELFRLLEILMKNLEKPPY